uniref:BMERB domain-containing protein n=1 Tax=Anopheles farauti TaxID=69004 RepID=A0A182QMY4_9DIPT
MVSQEGASDSEVNSTEISTDSEFDDEQPHRVPPTFHLEFKPLVEVDPTIKLVQNRAPLAVPRPGDYVLSKTASTEGIASKKSLELKKKYLLGEGTTGLGILKSGSASALDSKFKSFHSNITECQKLLNPAAQISPTTLAKSNSTAGQPPAIVSRDGEPPQSMQPANDTEKENLYEGKRPAIGNGLGSSNGALLGAGGNKRSSLVESINTTLVENKLNEIKSNDSLVGAATKEEQKLEHDNGRMKSHQQQPDNESLSNGHDERTKPRHNNIINNNNSNTSNHKNNSNNNNNNNDDEDDGNEMIEIIDLVTPEKVKHAVAPTATQRELGGGNETGAQPELKYITSMKHAYIDLTTDSPNCDRSLVETTLDFSIAAMKINGERSAVNSAAGAGIDSNENKIERDATNGGEQREKPTGGGLDQSGSPSEQHQQQQLQSQRQAQGEEGCHETTLQVPNVPWNKEEEEIESDSISESGSHSSDVSGDGGGSSGSSSSSSATSGGDGTGSSTSSVEDIPHFILDSTTSPETQPDERFVPRLEVRDATGELMQIDSLMIIDGRYIGDPEDLKLMERLPPDTQIAAEILQAEMNQDSIGTVVEDGAGGPGIGDGGAEEYATTPTQLEGTRMDDVADETVEVTAETAEQRSSLSDFVSRRNPGFKFDARNENKIDTLKNLPFVLDAAEQRPKQLNLQQTKPRTPTAAEVETDAERTPLAPEAPVTQQLAVPADPADSDSQDDTEVTTQNNLTETELSDWAADDAVSENFVDLEFALNSNKGTIRRNHRTRHGRLHGGHGQAKKLPQSGGSSNGEAMVPRTVPTHTGATEDGIIRNLALEDIEFMDTGSEEESCIETYSTTNRTMLKNRGYVEIMDPHVESKRVAYPPPSHHAYQHNHRHHAAQPKLVEAINKQIAASSRVDYIDQGAYLLTADEAKTPMNEEPSTKITFSALAAAHGLKLAGEPDIEEDSLLILSQGVGTTNSTATTEESEAVTVVAPATQAGSYLDSTDVSLLACKTAGGGDGSSSGRGSVASFSSSHQPPVHEKKSEESSRERKISLESLSTGKRSSLERKDVRKDSLKSIEDIGYEKYVKRLQQKIQQISNARDSLEVKKGKRKSSKGGGGGDADESEWQEPAAPMGKRKSSKGGGDYDDSEVQEIASPKLVADRGSPVPVGDVTQLPLAAGSVVDATIAHTVEPPKSVEKKIEEITKERVKQKDLIHDLVMDKLQTKKQLNAEKRLNRSRNRNNVLVGQSNGGGSHACSPSATVDVGVTELRNGSGLLEQDRVPQQQPARALPAATTNSASDVGAYKEIISTSTPAAYHQQMFVTPRTGAHQAPHGADGEPPLTTEQLREEARSRARLKSNQDLGLSPEDRLLLLRKKYHITLRGLTDDDEVDLCGRNKSDDVKCKDQQQQQQQQQRTKLITSKSVNDVSMLNMQQQQQQQSGVSPYHHHHHHLPHQYHPHHRQQPGLLYTAVDPTSVPHGGSPPKKLNDYISDPNLVHSGGGLEQDDDVGGGGTAGDGSGVRLRTRGKRKDRERRKSIIEMVSEFFNGRKKTDGGGGSKDASPTKDRSNQQLGVNGGGAQTEPAMPATSSSTGGGFLRFKISPKLKDKSKTKESSPYGGRYASEDCLNSNASNGSPTNANASSSSPSRPTLGDPNSYTPIGRKEAEELEPPPIPPLPLHYERSDDEGGAINESKNELKKMRAMSKTSRQAELKRLRIAQEIQREQEEIDVKIKDLETRGVAIEKELRGESETLTKPPAVNLGASDEGLVKEWLEIMSSITRLKVRDDELSIRQQELQLEHRHAQLKEELNMRLSYGKLDKNSSDVAAEGAILNEMLEIVAKRQALRPSPDVKANAAAVAAVTGGLTQPNMATTRLVKDTDI